jgi:quercetin dioxygenase-like cupin family protein
MTLTADQLQRFVLDLASRPELWAHLVRDASDARVYEQIWEDEGVNAWVICWSEDQDTGFHDHDESAAAITVISGRVREERLRLGTTPSCHEAEAGTTFALPATAIHRVLHAGAGPAVTIHAYSPPLTKSGAYRVGADGELERESLPLEQELRGDPALA